MTDMDIDTSQGKSLAFKLWTTVIILGVIMFLLLTMFYIVPAGYRGVILTQFSKLIFTHKFFIVFINPPHLVQMTFFNFFITQR